MLRTLLLTIVLALAALPVSAQLKRDARALQDFGRKLDAASEAPDFVGLAVVVVKDGRTVLLRTYGTREAGKRDKVTPDTVFRLASVSKGFAGVLAALEIREGRLDPTAKITDYVPGFRLRTPRDTNAVTVENVLSHRVGLPPFAYDNLLEAGAAPLEILGRYKAVKLVCPVGACFSYQNTAFDMAATAIEAVTNEPYGKLLESRLFDPLGMVTASVGRDGLVGTGNWARPHVLKEDGWRPAEVRENYYRLPAAAGVNASIVDMSRWLVALTGLRPDILPPEVLAEIQRPRVETPVETRRQKALKMPVTSTRYGLGWRISDYAGQKLVSHTGSVEGYIAHIAFLPDRKSGIAVLSNTRGARAAKIVPMWLDYELGLPPTDWMRLNEAAEAAAAPDQSAASLAAPVE